MSIQDEALAARIRDAFAMDRRISGLPLDVRVTGGEVFLKGAVQNTEQTEVARFIASGVPGVHHVNIDEVDVKEKSR